MQPKSEMYAYLGADHPQKPTHDTSLKTAFNMIMQCNGMGQNECSVKEWAKMNAVLWNG